MAVDNLSGSMCTQVSNLPGYAYVGVLNLIWNKSHLSSPVVVSRFT